MAGERPLPIEESRDEQQIVVIGPFTSTTIQQYAVWVADRDTVIDSAQIYGSLESSTDTVNAQLFRGAGKLASTGDFIASENTVAEMITAGRDITNDVNIGDATGTAAPFNQSWTVTNDENYISAGDYVCLDLSAAPAGITDYYVMLRIRTKIR